MIEIGDEFTFNLVCVHHSNEGYRFVLDNSIINDNFDIKLSETDTNYNQQVLNILDKCKKVT